MIPMTSGTPLQSTPDLGFQFSPGLAPAREIALLQSLTSSLPPGADVRTAGEEGATRVAVWLRPSSGPGNDNARAEGLAGLALLRSGESFAARVSPSLPPVDACFPPQSSVVAAASGLPREILIAG